MNSGTAARRWPLSLRKAAGFYEVMLNGHKHFDGGTAITCFNLSPTMAPHRRDHAAAVIMMDQRMMFGLRPDSAAG